MSPVTLGGIAAAAGGLLLVGVGVAAGRWQARRDWASHRAYTAVLERELARQERRVRYLQGQVAEALRVIERQDQANLDRADAEAAPSAVWILPDRRLN